jgi:hypothetical protein
MQKITTLGLAVVLALSANLGRAQQNGNELLRNCEMTLLPDQGASVPTGSMRNLMCTSYIWGLMDAHDVMRAHLKQARGIEVQLYCLPGQTSRIQVVRTLVNYLRANPQLLHVNSGTLFMAAMQISYPCK